MQQYWPIDENAEDTAELYRQRLNLVAVFNTVVGEPSSEGKLLQSRFIAGTLTYDEALSYVRYARYMIKVSSSKPTSRI